MIEKKVTLGGTDLQVCRLAFGCEQLGGFDWGHVDTAEVMSAIDWGMDREIRFFDTADIYGLGDSERNLGLALQRRRQGAILCSKFGVRRSKDGKIFYDNSRNWLQQSLETSLRNLRTDYLDLYLVHYRDKKTSWEDLFSALEEQVSLGKIRYYGFSNLQGQTVPESLPKRCIVFQTEFSLANRTGENLISSLIDKHRLTPFLFGTLGQGVLTGKYSPSNCPSEGDRRRLTRYVNFHGEKFNRNLLLTEKVREIALERGCTPAQVAVRWVLDRFARSVAVVGIKRREQLADLAEALNWNLSSTELESLSSFERVTSEVSLQPAVSRAQPETVQ